MANNSDPPSGWTVAGWNKGNTLGQILTRRNNEQKESTEEEEVEVTGVKSTDEQIAERMKRQEIFDLCSPTKAVKNNNGTTIVDNTTATDDDEMKRLLLVISGPNPVLKETNKEIIIKVLNNNNDTTTIDNTTATYDVDMKGLRSTISKLNTGLQKKNLYLEIQDTATDDDEVKGLRSKNSKLKTVLKKKNKKIKTIEMERRLYIITAVAGIIVAVVLLATIQFSDEVTLRESCSE